MPDRSDQKRSARPGINRKASPVRRNRGRALVRRVAIVRGCRRAGGEGRNYRDPYAGLGLDDSLMRNLVRIVALLRVASHGEMKGKGMTAAACDR